MDSIAPLFGGQKFSFVADSDCVLDLLLSEGYECLMYFEELNLPENCVSIQTSKKHFLNLKSNLDNSIKSRVLTLPLIAFDSSQECFEYFFNQLKLCNLNRIFESSTSLMRKFGEVGANINIKQGCDIDLSCHFNKKVQYSYPSQLLIKQGSIRSIAQYFEVNFNHLYTEFEPDFKLSGKFNFTSCLYAIHPSNDGISAKQMEAVKKLFNAVFNATNCSLLVKDNVALSLLLDNVEYIEVLKCIAGDLRKSEVTELAFGLNNDIIDTIDWQYNSQINEGCGGMHLGFGDGKSGIHMDFICPEKKDLLTIETMK